MWPGVPTLQSVTKRRAGWPTFWHFFSTLEKTEVKTSGHWPQAGTEPRISSGLRLPSLSRGSFPSSPWTSRLTPWRSVLSYDRSGRRCGGKEKVSDMLSDRVLVGDQSIQFTHSMSNFLTVLSPSCTLYLPLLHQWPSVNSNNNSY